MSPPPKAFFGGKERRKRRVRVTRDSPEGRAQTERGREGGREVPERGLRPARAPPEGPSVGGHPEESSAGSSQACPGAVGRPLPLLLLSLSRGRGRQPGPAMEEGAPCSRAPRPVLGLLLLLGLLFLSGAPPALGNEGGAAGSCKCPKTNIPPRNVQSIASKLESWEHCKYLVRFTFPKRNICGLDGEPWVEELKSLTPSKRKGAETTEASKGVLGPTLVSCISPLALTSTRPLARTSTDEPLQVQLDPQFTTAMPWAHKPSQEETPKIHLPSDGPFIPGATLDTPGLTRSPTTAGQGAAGVGPGHLAPQASPTQHNKIAVPVLLAIMLLLVAIIVFLLCRKNGQPCRRAPDTPLPPQDPDKREETLALRHSEET